MEKLKINLNTDLLLNVFLSVLITFGVGAFFSRYLGGLPIQVTQTTTQKASTFDVAGTGKSVVVPDQVEVSLGVREEAAVVKTAQDKVNATMDKLLKSLDDLGIDKKQVKTRNYSVYPRYDNNRIIGYEVSSSVTVKLTDAELANQVLDLAGQLGLDQAGGLSFSLSEEKEKQALNEAREMAIKEARDKGESLAKLAGLRLGKIVNVVESFGGGGIAMPRAGGGDMMAVEKTQIEPGESEMEVTVVLSYETL